MAGGIGGTVALAVTLVILFQVVVAGSLPTPNSLPDASGKFNAEPFPDSHVGMVPINVVINPDVDSSEVVLCIVKHQKRVEDPSALPMYKYLVEASGCNAPSAQVRWTIPQLHAFLERTELDWAKRFTPHGRAVWRPQGLVFHEARCGSTLFANMLQSIPNSVAYSESGPPADLTLRGAMVWSRQDTIRALRIVVRAMGRVPGVEHMFFKFQSAVTHNMDIVREAFPDTPFVFLRRNAVEVMASLLGTYWSAIQSGKDQGAIARSRATSCTRSMSAPPKDMAELLGLPANTPLGHMNVVEYCAAYIAFLEAKARQNIRQAEESIGVNRKGLGAGLVVEYTAMPDAAIAVARDLFGVPMPPATEEAMRAAATKYSKGTSPRARPPGEAGGGGEEGFEGDAEDKLRTAPPELFQAADKFVKDVSPTLAEFTLSRAVKLQSSSTPALSPVASADELAASTSSSTPRSTGGPTSGAPASRAASEATLNPKGNLRGADGGKSYVAAGKVKPGETIVLETPPEGATVEAYPRLFSLVEMLDTWSADDPRIPETKDKHQSLRVFDWNNKADMDEAVRYRRAEVPFVVRGVPSLVEANRKWSDDYLSKTLGDVKKTTEVSTTNHFMYYNRGASSIARGSNFVPPVRDVEMTYAEWIKKARDVEERVLIKGEPNRQVEHHYFRVTARQGLGQWGPPKGPAKQPDTDHAFVAQDLKMFDPTHPESEFFIIDASEQRGIHCRIGEAGILAESHYDGGRNFISMVRGKKRYILAPPSECPHFNLLTRGPSARHSKTDWGDPSDYRVTLANARATEVIIEAGDTLYVPSLWFHTPVALTTNIQCNSRSGSPPEGSEEIRACGFGVQVSEGGGNSKAPTPNTFAAVPPTPTPPVTPINT